MKYIGEIMVKGYLFLGFRVFALSAILTIQGSLHADDHNKNYTDKHSAVAHAQSHIKTDYIHSGLSDTGSQETDVRKVNFTNNLGGIVELDLMCQYETLGNKEEACLEYFRQIPITIRAEKEYWVKDGDEINVETKRNWELTIPDISNEALLSLKTFREIVLDHLMPKKKIPNFMDTYIWNPCNQFLLSTYHKVVVPLIKVFFKKESTTTITILTEIDPHCDSISCLDIILDLDKLHGENKLDIQVDHVNLNTHVTVKAKSCGSLPGTFF